MDPSPDYFAKLLRQIMKDRGLNTQRELAELMGVTPTHISSLLKARDLPGDDKMEWLSQMVGIDVDELRYFKMAVRSRERGFDFTKLKVKSVPLDRDQAHVIELMSNDNYAGAVQYLLEQMRVPQAPKAGGRTKKPSAGAAVQ